MPADRLGSIDIPLPVSSGLTFPLLPDFPLEMSRSWDTISHRFGGDAVLSRQVFSTLASARRFFFHKPSISIPDRAKLLDFYNTVQGSFQSFRLWVPNPDRTGDPIDFGPISGPAQPDPLGRLGTAYEAAFENTPLSVTDLANQCQSGMSFVEIISPDDAPTYQVTSFDTRFPSTALSTALLDQVQQLVPLIHILPRSIVAGSADDNIFLSDRRCLVRDVPVTGTQTYLPRILGLGDPGTDTVFSQDLSGQSESVRFTFGNADRAFSLLTRAVGLKYATISLDLFHVQTGILLQLWKGIIISFTRDGSPTFTVECSDGLYPITQQYPRRTVAHQCWKNFNDGVHCPWSTVSGVGDPLKCDYFFNSPNGCLSHGMSPYFGGHPIFPQSVTIKDNGTGTVGKLGRQTVTSTSIASDSMWGKPLPEIWCNSHGNPLNAFIANTVVAAVRDESDFQSVMGVVGVGPIGQFQIDDPRPGGPVVSISDGIPIPPGEGGRLVSNADGYPVLVAPLADGFTCHGFRVDITHTAQQGLGKYNNDLGLRQYRGDDPVPTTTDFWTQTQTHNQGAFAIGQGTPQRWDVPDPVYSQIDTGAPNTILPLAAGTALCEVRYAKSAGKGLAPSTTESHTLSTPIALGLTGATYDSSDFRSEVPGLVNPFWVMANTYFRALGIENADDQTQLASIVRSTIYRGDGTGCAEIADLTVSSLVGTGTETQFEFQGTISEFRPFRDWLIAMSTCCLGFFSFEYGRLALGIRSHAVPTSAFTVANMLVDPSTAQSSLSLSPANEAFEYIKITFANADLQYQQDTAEYLDKDHADYFGRAGTPLTTDLRSPGLARMSQALRVAATRVREEIGGILRPDQSNPYVEWDNNYLGSFRTTILGLGQDPSTGDWARLGSVISITHPDLATYPGPAPGSSQPGWTNTTNHTWAFRITRLTLHRDWSVTIGIKSVTDSMYDLDVGPRPQAVIPPSPPILFYPQPLGQWGPGVQGVQATTDDALFPSEFSFGIEQQYDKSTDFTAATAICTGAMPVNRFIPSTGSPSITRGSITLTDTGGALPGGITLRVIVCALDATRQRFSPPSHIVIVVIPEGTDTNKLTLHAVTWPDFSVATKYAVFLSDVNDDLIEMQTAGATQTGDIDIVGPLPARYSIGAPDPFVNTLKIGAKLIRHSGVCAGGVTEVTEDPDGGFHKIRVSDLADLTGADDWQGRVLSVIGRSSGPNPYLSFHIDRYDPLTGTFYLSTPVVTTDRDDLSVLVNDVVVVRNLGYDNSSDPFTITDAGYLNAANDDPHAGLVPDFEIGNVVRVIAGKSRGERANITGNTATSLSLDRAIPLDSTSVWIVEYPNWEFVADKPIANSAYNTPIQIAVPITAFVGRTLLFSSFITDTDGNTTDDGDSPLREMYLLHATPITPPGLVSFIPRRTNYGEIAFTDIVVRADFSDPAGIASVNGYVAYVEETEIDRFTAILTDLPFDSANPESYYTAHVSVLPVGDPNHFQAGDFFLINDPEYDYLSPSIGNGAFAPLTESITSTSDVMTVGVPATNSADTMPVVPTFYLLLDQEFVEVTSVETLADTDGNLTGYTYGITRGQLGTVAASHDASTIAYHLTNLDFRKYEIGMITAITDDGYGWDIIRHWPGDTRTRRAVMDSWLSDHTAGFGGLKAFKVKLKQFHFTPKSVTLADTPADPLAPGSTGGSSFVIPDYTVQLPHCLVVAMMAAAVNDVGEGPQTVYNCAGFDRYSDTRLPMLPGIRTLDGNSYLLPQWKGRIPNGLVLPIPWRVQNWAAVRCIYATVGSATEVADDEAGGILKLSVQEEFSVEEGTPGETDWSNLAEIQIQKHDFVSWSNVIDPETGLPFPPPTVYNNPYPQSRNGSDDLYWPTWTYGVTPYRCVEGDAKARWVVTDNGGSDLVCSLHADIDSLTSDVIIDQITPLVGPEKNNSGIEFLDYLKIDDEKMLVIGVDPDSTTGRVLVSRGELETLPMSHTAGTDLRDISAKAPKDLTVVLQT